AVLLDVPTAAAPAVTTRVNTSFAPDTTEGLVQLTVPALPIAGVVQVQPTADVSELNVMPVGNGSSSVADAAAFGPALATVIVYVNALPTVIGSGASVLVTDRSADNTALTVVL